MDSRAELAGEEVAVALERGADGQLEAELPHVPHLDAASKSLAPLGLRREPRAMRWAELFERATDWETTVEEVETALRDRRGDD